MLNNLCNRKSALIYCTLSLLLVLVMFIIFIINVSKPNNVFEYCLELFAGTKKETWVFLVAGSKGWTNYRHQADVAHAYQTLLNNGIPVDHIVVMMTDDVAYDYQNPYPGKLFNNPNGSDVHQGLQIDYHGKDVNTKNFFRVLTGNKKAMKNIGSGRVIESNHRANIFLNFVGHGTSGILAFPDSYLYADELNSVLRSMLNNFRFDKMLLYIEACKAGSLFDGILSENGNIFALTASGPRESSWSAYCIGDNETINLCLGDEFSVTWIEDQANIGLLEQSLEHHLVEKRTVLNHFNYIRTMVKQSNVMPYGDFSIGLDKLYTYIGKPSKVFSTHSNSKIQFSMRNNTKTMPSDNISKNTSKLYLINEKNKTIKNWNEQINHNNIMRQVMDNVLYAILKGVFKRWPSLSGDFHQLKEIPNNLPLSVFPCYRQCLNHINHNCFSLPKNIYSLNTVHQFFNLCTRVLANNKWKSVNFDEVFIKVVQDVCLKNSSTYSNLYKLTNID